MKSDKLITVWPKHLDTTFVLSVTKKVFLELLNVVKELD